MLRGEEFWRRLLTTPKDPKTGMPVNGPTRQLDENGDPIWKPFDEMDYEDVAYNIELRSYAIMNGITLEDTTILQ